MKLIIHKLSNLNKLCNKQHDRMLRVISVLKHNYMNGLQAIESGVFCTVEHLRQKVVCLVYFTVG